MDTFSASLRGFGKRGDVLVRCDISVRLNLENGMAVTTCTLSSSVTGLPLWDVTFAPAGRGELPTLGQLSRVTLPELHDTLGNMWPRLAAFVLQMAGATKSKG